MNRRPGHVNVTTEVAFCSFCGRPRTLRREERQLGTLVRTIVTCETCHRMLSSTIGVAGAEPAAAEPAAAEPAEVETTPAEVAAEPSQAATPTKKAAPAKRAPAPKAATAKSNAPTTRRTTKTK